MLRITDPDKYGPRNAIVAVCFDNDFEEVYMSSSLGSPDASLGGFEEMFHHPTELLDFDGEFETLLEKWPRIDYTAGEFKSLDDHMRGIIQQLATLHAMARNRREKRVGEFDVALARSVFTVPNLQLFVSAYFTYTQKYLPMIHKPTFRLEECSSRLMLAIFILGSKFCGPLDQVISLRQFEDIAEEFVFNGRIFHHQFGQGNKEGLQISRTDLENLQAAVIMEALLLSANDGRALVRLRAERHPRLVAAIRASGLFLTTESSSVAHSSWEEFAQHEAMIR